jgi:hypothetical protein
MLAGLYYAHGNVWGSSLARGVAGKPQKFAEQDGLKPK